MTDVSSILEQLERRHLAASSPIPLQPATINGLPFVRVRGLAAFWRSDRAQGRTPGESLTIGAHGHGAWLALAITGSPGGLDVYVAVHDIPTATRLLQSSYPGVLLDTSTSTLGTDLLGRMTYGGALTGIPSPRDANPATQQDAAFAPLTSVVRAMRGTTWTVVIRAWPLPMDEVDIDRDRLIALLSEVAPLARREVSSTLQQTRARTETVSDSMSQVMNDAVVNKEAEYAVAMLERELERNDSARRVGRWHVAVDFASNDERTARELGALLRSAVAGQKSTPEPIRVSQVVPLPSAAGVARGSAAANHDDRGHTLLSSAELALYLGLPTEETRGYQIAEYVPFDVDCPAPVGHNVITIGEVLDDLAPSGASFAVAADDLCKHALITGVTGSGKTTTIGNVLLQCARKGIPFLIVEPAKTEYRALLPSSRQATKGILDSLRIYTLGNDSIAPFRLNPFEFDTVDDPGISLLLSHIDLLKAVFNSAFVLYAPMPYVLEIALHELYEDKGWNLATGQNQRLPREHWARRHEFSIFPTLGDLHQKVGTVTRRLKYDNRIERDVIAGLQARIASLRVGSKGLMLDVPRGVPLDELLGYPTVLELENIGNDTEKAFIIGLIFARLYEFRRLQSATGRIPTGCQHVLVIEEAHRLLRRTNIDVDAESSNMRAQAVETFANLLSEVRRYGQSVVLAEQIPAKLADDAIKNTNVKVMHRIVAADDRETLAGATNMTAAQSARLATLLPGQAVVFAEGADRPYLVAATDVVGRDRDAPPDDRDIAKHAARYVNIARGLPVTDLEAFGIRGPTPGTAPEPAITQRVMQFLSDAGPAVWARIILRVIHSRPSASAEIAELERTFLVSSPQIPPQRRAHATRLLLALGAHIAIQTRSAARMIGFVQADALRVPLTHGLLHLLPDGRADLATRNLDTFVRAYESAMAAERGPFVGCSGCPSVCLFRADVQPLVGLELASTVVKHYRDTTVKTALERCRNVAKVIDKATGEWLAVQPKQRAGLEYCVALSAAAGMGRAAEVDFAHAMSAHLL